MANVNTTSRPLAQLQSATNPTIYNLDLPLAATEYSQVLSLSVKKLTIRCRGSAKIQLAFVSTESATKFVTIAPGAVFSEELINFSGTVYVQANKANQVVEILEWT